MKNHLKRNFTPASWLIARKENKYIVKPRPGAHARDFGLPLNIILKELRLGKTGRDVRNILRGKKLLVDGKRREDPRFIMGLMDILSLPEAKKYYRIILDEKGRLKIQEISEEESKFKLSKVLGKTPVKKGKLQINLHDGKNILTKEKVKVGDSLVQELPSGKIKNVLELKKGAQIFLLKGKHAGDLGEIQEIEGNKIIYQKGKDKIETLKNYAFVIGEKQAMIKIKND